VGKIHEEILRPELGFLYILQADIIFNETIAALHPLWKIHTKLGNKERKQNQC
jgi:hypothetical protein